MEISLVWRSKWTYTKVIFLAARYLAIVAVVLALWGALVLVVESSLN